MQKRADPPYVLWLGGIFDEATMLRRPGVNPAGRRMQMSLVKSILRQGVQVRTLGHAPEPLWPRGVLRDRGTDPLEGGITGETVAYWNLPLLREWSVSRAYLRGFERIVRRHGAPSMVFSYNAYPYNIAVGRRAQELGIPWVPIVADVPEPGPDRDAHDRAINEAAARVFLSWAEINKATNVEPKMHLDNGVDELRIAPNVGRTTDSPTIVYAGSLGKWGGVTFLLDAFRLIDNDKVQLVICGPGGNPAIDRAVAEDTRVRFLGLVPEERLREVYESATLFVNPRPSNLAGNAGNFPSKLLDYLQYGKPVVSTWTPGLAPEYRDVLAVIPEETPQSLARTIEETLAWSAERRTANAGRIREFLLREKMWDVHVERLLDWLRTEARIDLPARVAMP